MSARVAPTAAPTSALLMWTDRPGTSHARLPAAAGLPALHSFRTFRDRLSRTLDLLRQRPPTHWPSPATYPKTQYQISATLGLESITPARSSSMTGLHNLCYLTIEIIWMSKSGSDCMIGFLSHSSQTPRPWLAREQSFELGGPAGSWQTGRRQTCLATGSPSPAKLCEAWHCHLIN